MRRLLLRSGNNAFAFPASDLTWRAEGSEADEHDQESAMNGVVNATELRGSLLGVLRRVRGGQRITVIYRRRPAFQIVPLASVRASDGLLESDPLFRAAALGRSRKGPPAAEHDALLYRS